MKFLIDAQLPRRLAVHIQSLGHDVRDRLDPAACVSATEWRQDVATGVSPWNRSHNWRSVPKGQQVYVLRRSCRPVGTHHVSLSHTTGSRPWLQHAVPLGLNRSWNKGNQHWQKYAVTTKQILAERDREAAQLDAFLKELGYE